MAQDAQPAADTPDAAEPAPKPKPAHTNRLAGETSPYLLQHAHNPVDWFPWGPEAFAEAKRRGVPIFLSVGYSTCYWCHVMEREAFENEATAAFMNAHFVSIKVDREERPDVDDIYMAAVQMLTGSGGWPMSVFLTPPGATGDDDPGLKPFWGGTYFPKEPRGNYPSFTMVLNAIADAWKTKHAEVLQQADAITSAIRERLAARAEPAQIGPDQVSAALTQLMSMDDPTWGGFGSAPKFPQPVYLEFMLDALPTIKDKARRAEIESALRKTLDRMALGGVFDQVGGGFHRYSTDEKWLIPHFEKMLYDNAQLLDVYARAADLFHDDFYARIARRTAGYALREMRAHGDGAGAAEPGFFSAQDAEVAGREGQNYLWHKDEIRAALPADDADFAIKVYRLDEGPNFRDPHHPEDAMSNVLWLRDRPAALAPAFKMTTAEFLARLDRVNAALYAVRAKRPQPRTDDKVIAGWNGLMIAGLADAGRLLDAPQLTHAAARAADFILTKMRTNTGELARAWRVGSAGAPAVFEDYAFVIRGLLALDRAGAGVEPGADHSESRYLHAAIELADTAGRLFGDAEHGGYFDTAPDQSDLIVRTRSVYDGAVPSGQSVMIHDLLALAQRTGEARFLDAASRTLASMSKAIAQAPLGPVESTRALIAFLRLDRASGRDLLAEFGMGAGAPAIAPEAAPESPVQVFASADSAVVTTGKPSTVELEIRVADGWHINAHEPGVDGLEPLRVRIEGGAGVRAVVDYPAGEPLNVAWAPKGERPMVHEGSVRLTVRLERTDAEWSGAPTIVVDYQACTDSMCAQPASASLRFVISGQ